MVPKLECIVKGIINYIQPQTENPKNKKERKKQKNKERKKETNKQRMAVRG